MLERALALSKLKAYLSDIGAQIAVDVIDAAPNSVLNGVNPFVYRIFCRLVTHRLARLTTRCVTCARACLYHRPITTAIATLTTIASAYATILPVLPLATSRTHAEHVVPCLVALLPADKPTKEDFAVAATLERRGVSLSPIKWFPAKRIAHRKNFSAVADVLCDAGGQSTGLPVWWSQYVAPFLYGMPVLTLENDVGSVAVCRARVDTRE